ncbi:T9SS type A sorting domain-containing protein [Taishania pollutisoli]|nr:T9SS type A sorting domain-containing protein [Taishania pollutisoli]
MNTRLIFYSEKLTCFVLFFLFVCVLYGSASGQNSYMQRINGGWSRSVISVSNSDTAVWVGSKSANNEIRVVKTYRDSLVDWSISIGGGTSSSDRANDVVETADGYVMVGNTASFGAGGTDIIVTKVNFSGVHQWTRAIGTSSTDYGNAIIKTSDGNIAICGKVGSSTVDIAYFAKLNNSDGSFISEKQLRNGSGASEFFDLIQTADDGFLCVGKTNNDFFMMKMTAALAVTFGKKWGSGSTDELNGVVENSVNDYTVFGRTYGFGAGGSDGYAMRFTSSGSTITNVWSNTYGSVAGEEFRSVAKSGSGYLAAGWQDRDTGGQDVTWIVAIASDGNASLFRGYGSVTDTEDSEANGVTVDASGNILVAGLYSNGATHFSMMKVPSDGLFCAHSQEIGSVMNVSVPALTDQTATGFQTVTKSALLSPVIGTGDVIDRTCSTPLVALSISLIDFDGQPAGDVNKLFWTTASERNNDYFTLYRSENGNNWEKAAVLDGAGNSSEILNYEVYDEEPYYPVTYYTLKQTDYDGTATLSEVIVITRTSGEELLVMYPNPVKDEVKLLVKDTKAFVLEIFSTDSRLVEQFEFDKHQGLVIIDLSSYPNGLYQVKFIQNNKIQNSKIIIQ